MAERGKRFLVPSTGTGGSRVTVWHGQYRNDAVENVRHEENTHPHGNIAIEGEPGHWKVRRDRCGYCDADRRPPNSHCQHPTCKAERGEL